MCKVVHIIAILVTWFGLGNVFNVVVAADDGIEVTLCSFFTVAKVQIFFGMWIETLTLAEVCHRTSDLMLFCV